MTQTVVVRRGVRRSVEDTSAFVTDMHALTPALSTFERCTFIGDTDDGDQLWDVFLQSATIYLGGRVLATAEPRRLHWHSLRGTRHTFEALVEPDGEYSVLTLTMAFTLTGLGTSWFTELIGRGIVSRTLGAAIEQIRHHLEFESDSAAS